MSSWTFVGISPITDYCIVAAVLDISSDSIFAMGVRLVQFKHDISEQPIDVLMFKSNGDYSQRLDLYGTMSVVFSSSNSVPSKRNSFTK